MAWSAPAPSCQCCLDTPSPSTNCRGRQKIASSSIPVGIREFTEFLWHFQPSNDFKQVPKSSQQVFFWWGRQGQRLSKAWHCTPCPITRDSSKWCWDSSDVTTNVFPFSQVNRSADVKLRLLEEERMKELEESTLIHFDADIRECYLFYEREMPLPQQPPPPQWWGDPGTWKERQWEWYWIVWTKFSLSEHWLASQLIFLKKSV